MKGTALSADAAAGLFSDRFIHVVGRAPTRPRPDLPPCSSDTAARWTGIFTPNVYERIKAMMAPTYTANPLGAGGRIIIAADNQILTR